MVIKSNAERPEALKYFQDLNAPFGFVEFENDPIRPSMDIERDRQAFKDTLAISEFAGTAVKKTKQVYLAKTAPSFSTPEPVILCPP